MAARRRRTSVGREPVCKSGAGALTLTGRTLLPRARRPEFRFPRPAWRRPRAWSAPLAGPAARYCELGAGYWARGAVPTPDGQITVAWARHASTYNLTVHAPRERHPHLPRGALRTGRGSAMSQDVRMATERGAPGGSGAGDGLRPGRAEPTMLYLMKQVELAVRSHLDELLKPAEITALQYTALTVLERHPDLTSAQLARNSFVTTQTMADMVTALEARCLIGRRRDPLDRRRLVLGLTVDGSALIRRYRGKVRALERQMLSGLTGRQAEELRGYLYACRVALSDGPPH